jgi:VanZ family protein
MKKLFHWILYVMPFLFWIAICIVSVLMLITLPPPKVNFQYLDKIEHASIFMVLAGMGFISWPLKTKIVTISLISYGGMMELAQGAFTTTREASWADWAADALGVFVALIISFYIVNRLIKLPNAS